MQLKDYIKVYEDVLSPEDISSIMEDSKQDDCWIKAPIANNPEDPDVFVEEVRKTDLMHFDEKHQSYTMLHKKNEEVCLRYMEEFPDLMLYTSTGHDLLKYEVGGYFKRHTDAYAMAHRTVSLIYLINEDYGGGEIDLLDGEVVLKPKAGTCVVFPSSFQYPHEIKAVTSGTRWSIVSWSV
jgi:predicted 2-oxoglutarate/Fe(II)-dependent dioxygenase YbiX